MGMHRKYPKSNILDSVRDSGRDSVSSRRKLAEKTGAVLIALLFWQAAAVLVDSSILIAAPSAVLRRFLLLWREDGFFQIVCFTFSHIAAGYLLAAFTGFLLAVTAAGLPVIEKLLWPWVVSVRSVPVASMVVMLLIWVSSRRLPVVISFLVVFPVVYNNVLSGMKHLDPELEEMSAVFRIGRLRHFRYVAMPQLSPYLLSACSVTAGMAWKAGVAAEIIGTPPLSVGKQIYQSKIWLDTEMLFAWTLMLVVLSVVFEKLITALLKKLLKGGRT